MFMWVIAAAILIGLISGGRIANLGQLNFRYFYWVLAAYLIQAGIDYWAPGHPFWGYPYLHIVSYLILFFVLWQNRRLPGMYLILLGTLLNFTAIALNGGQMPVSSHVLPAEIAQALAAGHGGTHSLLTGTTKLKFLTDTIYINYLNYKQLISLGDVVIDAGAFGLIFAGMRKRRPE